MLYILTAIRHQLGVNLSCIVAFHMLKTISPYLGSVLLWWKWLSFRRLIVWGKCKEIPLISLLTRASSRSTFVEPLRVLWEPRLRNTPPVIGEFRLVSHTKGLPFRPLCPVSSMACQPMVHVYEAYTLWRHTCGVGFMATGACIIIYFHRKIG